MYRQNTKLMKSVEFAYQVGKTLFDSYLIPEHFLDALQLVQSYTQAEVAFLWMEQDECLHHKVLTDRKHPFFVEQKFFRTCYPKMYQQVISSKGIYVNGKKDLLKRFGEEGKRVVETGVERLVLLPIYDAQESLMAILGICNSKEPFFDFTSLQQVAYNFSMALNHYFHYQKLYLMGSMDRMTNLKNRNSYHEVLQKLSELDLDSIGCVYVDVNGLHDVNNHLGHKAGDEMLRVIANHLKEYFDEDYVFRVGGDEFVILCVNWTEEKMFAQTKKVQNQLRRYQYELSVGVRWVESHFDIEKVVNDAECLMRTNKQEYYRKGGKEDRLRTINQHVEKMAKEKQDVDLFLSVLAPEFKGVYFVDLDRDTLRHIFIPDYFEEILGEIGGKVSEAMKEYANRFVEKKYWPDFQQVCDYTWLKEQLDCGKSPSFQYKKLDDEALQLRIIKLKRGLDGEYNSLWIFS